MEYKSLLDVESTPIQQSRGHSNVLLVCAMKEELAGFLFGVEKLKYSSSWTQDKVAVVNLQHCTIYAINLGISYYNQIPLVNLIKEYNINEVINFGTCASLNNDTLGTVYVSNKCRCFSLNMEAFGYIQGTHLKKEIPEYGPIILSDNFFLEGESNIAIVKQKYPDAVAFDMESYMVRSICLSLGIPFLSMRAVSDGGSNESFEVNLGKAAEISAMYAIKFLERTSVEYFLKGIRIE